MNWREGRKRKLNFFFLGETFYDRKLTVIKINVKLMRLFNFVRIRPIQARFSHFDPIPNGNVRLLIQKLKKEPTGMPILDHQITLMSSPNIMAMLDELKANRMNININLLVKIQNRMKELDLSTFDHINVITNLLYGIQDHRFESPPIQSCYRSIIVPLINSRNDPFLSFEFTELLSYLKNFKLGTSQSIPLLQSINYSISRIPSSTSFSYMMISRTLSGMKFLSSETPEVDRLINSLASLYMNPQEHIGCFTVQGISMCLLGMQSMGTNQESVRHLLRTLNPLFNTLSLSTFKNNKQSNYTNNHKSSSSLKRHQSLSKHLIKRQSVRMILSGLEHFSPDYTEVSDLLRLLTMILENCNEPLIAQDVVIGFNSLSSMLSLSLSASSRSIISPEFSKFISSCCELFLTCTEPPTDQQISMIFKSLKSLPPSAFQPNGEGLILLRSLSHFLHLHPAVKSNETQTNHPDLLLSSNLNHIDSEKSDLYLYKNTVFGSDYSIEQSKPLTTPSKTYPFSGQALSICLSAFKHLDSQLPETKALLSALHQLVLASPSPDSDPSSRLTPLGVSLCLSGLKSLSSSHSEVRDILLLLSERIEKSFPSSSTSSSSTSSSLESSSSSSSTTTTSSSSSSTDLYLSDQGLVMSLTGLERTSSEYPESRRLLRALLPLIPSSTYNIPSNSRVFNSTNLSLCFFGLQNMKSDHKEVLDLLSSLLIHFSHAIDHLEQQQQQQQQQSSSSMTSSFSIHHLCMCIRGLRGLSSESRPVRRLLPLLSRITRIALVGNDVKSTNHKNEKNVSIQIDHQHGEGQEGQGQGPKLISRQLHMIMQGLRRLDPQYPESQELMRSLLPLLNAPLSSSSSSPSSSSSSSSSSNVLVIHPDHIEHCFQTIRAMLLDPFSSTSSSSSFSSLRDLNPFLKSSILTGNLTLRSFLSSFANLLQQSATIYVSRSEREGIEEIGKEGGGGTWEMDLHIENLSSSSFPPSPSSSSTTSSSSISTSPSFNSPPNSIPLPSSFLPPRVLLSCLSLFKELDFSLIEFEALFSSFSSYTTSSFSMNHHHHNHNDHNNNPLKKGYHHHQQHPRLYPYSQSDLESCLLILNQILQNKHDQLVHPQSHQYTILGNYEIQQLGKLFEMKLEDLKMQV